MFLIEKIITIQKDPYFDRGKVKKALVFIIFIFVQ